MLYGVMTKAKRPSPHQATLHGAHYALDQYEHGAGKSTSGTGHTYKAGIATAGPSPKLNGTGHSSSSSHANSVKSVEETIVLTWSTGMAPY